MLTDQERIALERLEQERERRIREKIATGEVVCLPPLVVGALGSIAAARTAALAAVRAGGEKRNVVFGSKVGDEGERIDVIITGVPRSGREPDDYRTPAVIEPPAPSVLSRRTTSDRPVSEPRDQGQPAAQKQIEPAEIHRIWAQTEQPSDRNPGGSVIEGQYRIVDGMVRVADMEGKLLGVAPIGPGDDAKGIARRILRDKGCALLRRVVGDRAG
jgi:hypothetical protein